MALQGQVPNYSKAKLKRIALTAERLYDPITAIDYYEAYLEKSPNNTKYRYRLAENYRTTRNYSKAAEEYQEVIRRDKENYPMALFYLAQMENSLGKLDLAKEHYEKFRKVRISGSESYSWKRLAKNAIEGIEQRKKGDTINAQINRLDNSINMAHIESSPFYLDDKTFIYSALRSSDIPYVAVDDFQSRPKRALYYAKLENNSWKYKGLWKGLEQDESLDIGGASISPDKNHLYFTKCKPNELGVMQCQIWRATKNKGQWVDIIKLPSTINVPNRTTTQPTVGFDGKKRETLYFVSDRDGGRGNLDIWYSTFDSKSKTYRTPRNAGSKINTKGDEVSPYYDSAGDQLLFSSDGQPGYGGFDLFRTYGERSRWAVAEPLKAPINGPKDDHFLAVNPNGKEGIFASNREGSISIKHKGCCDDLFQYVYFHKYDIDLKLQIADQSNTIRDLENVDIKIFRYRNLEDSTTILLEELKTDPHGRIESQIETGESYLVQAKKTGFLLNETTLDLRSKTDKEGIREVITLEPLPKEAIKVKQLYYETNKAELSPKIKEVIDQTIYKVLIDNPEIIVEISAHTDDRGTEEFNMTLSQERAENVVNYLIDKGISKSRLKAKGYGESNPVAPNQTEDGSDNPLGRSLNRRTEIKVIGTIDMDID